MKFIDEFRASPPVMRALDALRAEVTRPWNIMEICGGQTHAILRFGIDQLLPEGIRLIHGPGCPVCVTPAWLIDAAIEIARTPGALLASFGDMVRVPGTAGSLMEARSAGAEVRIVESPMGALDLARRHPEKQIVFFGVGFETTAPSTALAVSLARQQEISNFFLLPAHVLVPPALEAILGAKDCQVNGILAAGHVCTVEGEDDYARLASKWHVPVVITGFEPLDLVLGISRCIGQLERGESGVENAYARAVRTGGNKSAQALVRQVYEPVDAAWRGIGVIPLSGLRLRPEYAAYDALQRFQVSLPRGEDSRECRAGLVLQGVLEPTACPAFGTACTPDHPLGAPMVSAEGACSAFYRYKRNVA